MDRTDKIGYEFQKAILQNPNNASLYNDYAVFLSTYKKNYVLALKYFNRAIKFEPDNKIYKSNFNKTIQKHEKEFLFRHNVFMFFLIGVMIWIGVNGYTNIMNLLSLFVLAQIVLIYQKNNIKKLYLCRFYTNT